MPKFNLRLFALSILCTGGAFGQVQGTFAQIAYGASWQTTFTMINLNSTNPASVTLRFYGDDGSPLNAPVQGFGNTAVYTFTVPPSGAQNVVLSSPDPTIQGWATMSIERPRARARLVSLPIAGGGDLRGGGAAQRTHLGAVHSSVPAV